MWRGKKFEQKNRVKGWAGRTPVSGGEVAKFQELVLHPQDTRDEVGLREAEDGEGLVHLHGRLVAAAAEIKATTSSSRNWKSFVCLKRSDRWRPMQPIAGTP